MVWAVAGLISAVGVAAMGQAVKPDLTIVKIEKIDFMWWGTGESFKVIATVKNLGGAPSTPTHLRWRTLDGDSTVIISVPSLAPGLATGILLKLGVECPRWFRSCSAIPVKIEVEVDPFNRVQEANEDNNAKTGIFTYRIWQVIR